MASDDVLEARRQRIAQMTLAEKQQLLQVHERFAKLPEDEKRRLRQLHEQIAVHGNADQLCRVMHRYHEWLKTLSPYARAELLELEPAERIKRIKKLRADQAKAKAAPLSLEDAEGVFRWMREYAVRHGPGFVSTLPEQQQRQLQNMPELRRRGVVFIEMWRRWQSGKPGSLPPPSEKDLATLRQYLSEETRRRLETRPPAEQWQIIGAWLRHARHRFATQNVKAFLPPADGQTLDEFFEKELTDELRDRLMSMPPEEMQRALQKLYWERHKPNLPGLSRPGGPSPPRRPGMPGPHHGPPRHHLKKPEKPPDDR